MTTVRPVDAAPAESAAEAVAEVPAAPSGAGWQGRFVALCGRVLVLGGFWSLVSLILRPVHWLHRGDDLFDLVNLPVGPSLFSVVLLFVVGGAVRRRIKAALWLLLAFQFVAAVYLVAVLTRVLIGAAQDLHISVFDSAELALNAGLTVVLVVLLFRSRSAFSSRLEPGARGRSLAVLVLGLGASLVTSLVATMALPGHLTDLTHRLGWAIRVPLGLEPKESEPGWAGEYGHHWISALVGFLSAASLVAAVVVFFRSVRSKAYLTEQDELELRGLLLQTGERDSLGYFATRHDKSVIFNADRSAAVTYRVLGSVSLASADPVGPVSAWPTAIGSWLAESRNFGWFPAALSTSEEGARAYVAAGLKALPIGDEAIIDVDSFTLEGPTMQPIRRAVHRVQRAGYRISVLRHSELTPAELAEVTQRAEQWRGEDTERGFSMALGRLADPADAECVAVLAHHPDGRLQGLLSLVPWGARGLSLDLMRRDRSSENGLIEAMVAELVGVCRDEWGVRQVSLNFAMFRGVFSAAERVGAGPVVRLTSHILTFASRFWQIETLYRSNARYLPGWQRRYLCYDSSLTLTRVALAAGRAEGFLPEIRRGQQRPRDEDVTFAGHRLPFAEAVSLQRRTLRRAIGPRHQPSQHQRSRSAKLDRLKAAGLDPYPVSVARTCDIAGLVHGFSGLAPGAGTGRVVSVVGRVRAIRDLGGVLFAVLQDGPATIQALVTVGGCDQQPLLRATLDLGDYLSVTGEVGASRTGELSVLVNGWTMAAKCLRPLPDLHAGLKDPDLRVRQRHLDLIINADARTTLVQRSLAVRQIRECFAQQGFLEVETPMLQSVHGGANARPFVTHINAYDATLYLRIAPELYLKRLCVGGMSRIFELNRNFRNEGADSTHNPEFTSVEAYQAYSDYLAMAELTADLIRQVATAVHGSPIARRPVGGSGGGSEDVDLSLPWRWVTVHDAVSQACGAPVDPGTSVTELAALCGKHGVRMATADASAPTMIVKLYETLVEKQTVLPTFYADFPVETSPLTRAHRKDPRLAERWDLVAFGAEIATAYSELIDPAEQRRRLTEQSIMAAAGDPEAMQLDEGFLSALEYAMPPTGGLGLGVDRLVMMLTGASIRQTLAFPFVRPGGR